MSGEDRMQDLEARFHDVRVAMVRMGETVQSLQARFEVLRVLIEGEEGVVVHGFPGEGELLLPCCKANPADISPWERMALDPASVTCGVPADPS